MEDFWYRDGLRFKCTRCGNCCTGEPGYVWLNREEIQRISKFLGKSEQEFLRGEVRQVGVALSLRERPNGDCILYDRDGGGCTVYPVRPRQCRTWPFWKSNLKSKEAWERTCKECPGAGKGKLHSANQIVQLASEIHV